MSKSHPHRLTRRHMFPLAGLVGALAGTVALLFGRAVALLDHAAEQLQLLTTQAPASLTWALVLIGASLGWASVRVTQACCREASGSGIPHIQAVLQGQRSLQPLRLLLTKVGAGLLALATGMSLGREGPTIHMGGACAAWIGSRFQLPSASRKTLLAAGAGAGLAAAFNAPLAGFLFVLEELRRDMARSTYGPALVCAVVAVVVSRLFQGQQSEFGLEDGPPFALSQLPVVALVGLSAALLGLGFNYLLLSGLRQRERVGLPKAWLGAAMGALGMILICCWPGIEGGGHRLTTKLLLGDPVISAGWLPTAIVGKLLYTVGCYASGVPGGIFAPLLSIGAMCGFLIGKVGSSLGPVVMATPSLLATVGMAGILAGSVRAPLTGVVLIVEMTGQYHLLFALLLAAFVAYTLAESLGSLPIYEALLERDLDQTSGQILPHREAESLEITVAEEAPWTQQALADLRSPFNVRIILFERQGQSRIPDSDVQLQAGDLVTVLVGPGADGQQLRDFLEGARPPS